MNTLRTTNTQGQPFEVAVETYQGMATIFVRRGGGQHQFFKLDAVELAILGHAIGIADERLEENRLVEMA
jgi:hypothetical protein